MRCERCGAETEDGRLCDACQEAGPPDRRSNPVFGFYVPLGMLAVLAFVVLLPLLADHPHRARQSRDLYNIKMLALAIQTYSQDYNETFPGWVSNPDGAYAHNTWDEQASQQVKGKDVFTNGGAGIRSYSQTGTHDRVLTYGLNGLLIAPGTPDGNADFGAVHRGSPPPVLSPSAIGNPAGTILLAELATGRPFPGIYGQRPSPLAPGANKKATGTPQWQAAHDGWIDISPRDWVENGGPRGSYYEPYAEGVTEYGVMRISRQKGRAPGLSVAFCDGHVKYMRIGHTVGLGTTTQKGLKITEDNCWSPENTNNMWLPQ